MIFAKTCTETGVVGGTYCTACNNGKAAAEAEIAINAEAHAWNDGEVTTAPTCSAKGVKTYTCTHDAEHTKMEEIAIDSNAHSYECNKDETNHWKECECGAKSEASAHTSLTSVVIPNSVTLVDVSAFNGCSGLKSVTFENGATEIGTDAFKNCSNWTTLTINSGAIGKQVFFKQTILTTIVIGEDVTSIGYRAFAGCTKLANVELNEGLQTILDEAFGNCVFTSIEIPVSVASIGANAFKGCANLKTINYAGTADQWAALKVTIGENVTVNCNYQG